MTTGTTITGFTTTGLTSRPSDGDIGVQPLLYAAEAAPSEPGVYPKADTNTDPNFGPKDDSWRGEVAARLERYRTRRRPRTPRYPSLLLPFDAPESWSRPAPPAAPAKSAPAKSRSAETESATAPARAALDFAFETGKRRTGLAEPIFAEACPETGQTPEQSAKVIEFPRSAAIPVFRASDLADPVFDRDRPRIVEAPEILPPPPALGGMLIEPAQQELADGRGELPAALPCASIAQRALAALVDGAILAAALTAFAAVFFRLNLFRLDPSVKPLHGPLPILAAALGVAAVLLWAAYEFLFVVYTGSTPGLRAVRLRLAGFDGSPLSRRSRRWRVLASFLSAFSAGLGYLWCVLDEDALCWHDRITRTHVQPENHAE